jgi:cation transporter-like permease
MILSLTLFWLVGIVTGINYGVYFFLSVGGDHLIILVFIIIYIPLFLLLMLLLWVISFTAIMNRFYKDKKQY